MTKTIKQVIVCGMAVVMLALAAGIAFISMPVNTAHAAGELSAGQVASSEQGALSPQWVIEGAITPAPVNQASMYQVYGTYLDFNPSPARKGGCYLYMEYKQKGTNTWKRSGYMGFDDDYTIKGLKPNKWYYARLYYAPNGNFLYGYTGNSAYSNIIKFKTGPNKKPAVKSVSVKAVKVQEKRQHVFGYVVYWGSMKFYKYKVKTTVTFKKAPKTKYVWVNGKKFKGGKKKYTVTSGWRTTYSKPSKNKWKVMVYTAQNKDWGGYSKMYSKSKKIG